MDYIALQAELLAGHPGTGNYSIEDALATDELNAVNRTRTKASVTGSEVANATNSAELAALSTADQDRWINLCGIDNIDTTTGPGTVLEAALFGPSTMTRNNLLMLRTETISRATELNLGFVVIGDVQNARAI